MDTLKNKLLQIAPSTIEPPTQSGKTYYSKGDFIYYHYACDGHNDVVWIPIQIFILWNFEGQILYIYIYVVC